MYIFLNILKVINTTVNLPDNIGKNWIAGFFSDEGCFLLKLLVIM